MFVGVNGSGKSTLLYALAKAFGESPLNARVHHQGSYVEVHADGTLLLNINLGGGSWRGSALPGFGYSGGRTLESHALQAIQEPRGDPRDNALSFTRTADSAILLQWIANTKAKQALALARGDATLAAQRGRAITAIEEAVSRMVDKDIRFVLREEPLDVRIAQNDVELSIDALPDGVKSILSWLADVLMRLDRLDVQREVDILHRSFALFLDEIDVHMHPAWQRKILPVVQSLFPNAISK